jgi:diguanylate cyclase (GGDEF)-like protein
MTGSRRLGFSRWRPDGIGEPTVNGDLEQVVDAIRVVPGACLAVAGSEIIAVNDEVIELTGIPRSRLVGAPLDELVLPEYRSAVHRLLAGAGGTVSHAEVRLAFGLRPLALSARRTTNRLALVGVRSMTREMELSATAGGPLTHDQVTGLPNRNHVLEQLHQRLHETTPRPVACLAAWVDDLDRVVAERGTLAGEQVLRQVGQRISSRLRGPDLLGRFDEHGFLVVMASDMGRSQLEKVASRLRDEIAFPVEHHGALLSFTASMAVAPLGTRRPSIEHLLTRLDSVARRAAAQGGGLLDAIDL